MLYRNDLPNHFIFLSLLYLLFLFDFLSCLWPVSQMAVWNKYQELYRSSLTSLTCYQWLELYYNQKNIGFWLSSTVTSKTSLRYQGKRVPPKWVGLIPRAPWMIIQVFQDINLEVVEIFGPRYKWWIYITFQKIIDLLILCFFSKSVSLTKHCHYGRHFPYPLHAHVVSPSAANRLLAALEAACCTAGAWIAPPAYPDFWPSQSISQRLLISFPCQWHHQMGL